MTFTFHVLCTLDVDVAHLRTAEEMSRPGQGGPTMMTSSAPTISTNSTSTGSMLLHAQAMEQSGNPTQAIQHYTQVIEIATKDADALKDKETAIMRIGSILAIQQDVNGLARFIKELEPVWSNFARAKSAKLIRDLLDTFSTIPTPLATTTLITLTRSLIQWCLEDKRSFLKQALESRLGHLYLRARQFTEALALISDLLRELKRMDDKLTLVQVHLLECKVYFELKNMAKAKAALTAARSAANAVYCPPLIQAALDLQSGILHAEDTDFKTAYSYFIEALDAFSTAKDPLGAQTLKYMILCKIMIGAADDIDGLVNGKLGQNFSLGTEVEAMKAVGEAYKARSLKLFEAALQTYPAQLTADIIIQTHFSTLYDALLQQNILRIIEPYSRLQISHIAETIGLDVTLIERKLSQMILDKVLSGVLDQNDGCLVVIEEPPCDDLYKTSLDLFKNLDQVVDSLYTKATKL